MHAQGAGNYAHFKECHAYETAFELKKEGKVRHVGISFHDKPEVLEQILTEYPEVEVVQIQFNFIDTDTELACFLPVFQILGCVKLCVVAGCQNKVPGIMYRNIPA